jgi:hypothetical protein
MSNEIFYAISALYFAAAWLLQWRKSRRLEKGVETLLFLCESCANFENGNKGPSGYPDEGEVKAYEMIDRVRRETGVGAS